MQKNFLTLIWLDLPGLGGPVMTGKSNMRRTNSVWVGAVREGTMRMRETRAWGEMANHKSQNTKHKMNRCQFMELT
jgi:hypothetical protein